MAHDLNSLVAGSAQMLGLAAVDEASTVSARVLGNMAEFFTLDSASLRHNDHRTRVTSLIAHWPRSAVGADGHLIDRVHFDNADPVLALAENLRELLVVTAELKTDELRARIPKGSDVERISLAVVPLMAAGGVASGHLEFLTYEARQWSTDELDAFRTIASLFAHFKSRVDAEVERKRLARQDDLTGLWNRATLEDHLGLRLAHADADPVAVLNVGLDRLGTVNDFLGHLAGDQLLVQFSDQLRSYVSEVGFLARPGDDEFVVVLNESTTRDDAETFARHLRAALHGRFTVGPERVTRSASIGVAVGLPGCHTASDLMNHAAHALAAVKANGGNDVAVFCDDLAASYDMRTDIELQLPGIAEGDDLVLHFQPEIDLHTRAIVAIETVARWNHPTRGSLTPEQFMPVAEATNQAAALGRRILWLSCEQLHQWRLGQLAPDVVLRVKLSPAQMLTHDFRTYLAATLDHFELPADALALEFQESTVLFESEVGEALHRLKDTGVGLVLDGFGTGFSAFAGLKALPIDTLKVDDSFVQRLTEDIGNIAIIRSMAALAHEFGLELVANGLRHPMDAGALMALGCRRAQGPLVSELLDADAATQLLRAPVVAHPAALFPAD